MLRINPEIEVPSSLGVYDESKRLVGIKAFLPHAGITREARRQTGYTTADGYLAGSTDPGDIEVYPVRDDSGETVLNTTHIPKGALDMIEPKIARTINAAGIAMGLPAETPLVEFVKPQRERKE